MGAKTTPPATGSPLSLQVPQVTEPRTMTDLTCTAHLHGPTDLRPPFCRYKPGRLFGSLGTVFEMSVRCFPGVGLPERNPFPASLPLISLP